MVMNRHILLVMLLKFISKFTPTAISTSFVAAVGIGFIFRMSAPSQTPDPLWLEPGKPLSNIYLEPTFRDTAGRQIHSLPFALTDAQHHGVGFTIGLRLDGVSNYFDSGELIEIDHGGSYYFIAGGQGSDYSAVEKKISVPSFKGTYPFSFILQKRPPPSTSKHHT